MKGSTRKLLLYLTKFVYIYIYIYIYMFAYLNVTFSVYFLIMHARIVFLAGKQKQSSLLQCGTRPNEWGAPWDSNSLV